MASVSMSEKDFDALVDVMLNAHDRGDTATAKRLDKIVRKLSAALTNEKYRALRAATGSGHQHRWQDVPSLLPQH